MKEALLYEKLDNQRVRCNLCAHRCIIAPGRKGICQVRENRDGVLYTLVYGIPLTQAVDPIEKKPLFHFYPGSAAFSIATVGCNFRCSFCQNWDISQMPRERGRIVGHQAAPEEIVRAAQRSGSRSIAYTYTEPTIFFEYTYDIARLANAAGIASVYVTNGYMTPEMLDLFQGTAGDHGPWLDAANVDLKAFRDQTYKEICGARLQPVLDALKKMKELGVWVEVTTLVVPGMNDGEAELSDIAQFIAVELGVETPWHISRFHPDYQMTDRGPTPAATLHRAYDLGRQAGLRYVYVGNMPDAHLEDTLCPNCGRTVVVRWGFSVRERRTHDGKCDYCGALIDGVGI
ncbi:MAG: AmmeMemoRadiSam system radical SAM enzyme [Anaerolineae bacterium]|nr:AmmeMemoRadiSam system radical SAM enzyme [Anaerolineae bacterium]